MPSRTPCPPQSRWVVKMGSSLVTAGGQGLCREAIDAWVRQTVQLRKRGIDIVLVTSGAVAEGVLRLGWKTRPQELHRLQAAAAVGQMGLVQAYESAYQQFGLHTAQVLLTQADFNDRQRYLNARSALRTLVDLNVIPVINENDTVATDEIRFGDNDTLAGSVANLVGAHLLVLLTDQAGLYDKDPRHAADARLVSEGTAGDPALEVMAGDGSTWGRGGMRTKLWAATRAARSGAATIIASGQEPDVLIKIADGVTLGTLLKPAQEPLAARKQWLVAGFKPQGELILDDGAIRVLREAGRSLLAVGVTQVRGNFSRGELVLCLSAEGVEIARGLANYSAEETRKIMKQPSDRFKDILGYVGEPELIHRDNLVVNG